MAKTKAPDVSTLCEAAYQKGLALGQAQCAQLQIEKMSLVQQVNGLNVRCLDLLLDVDKLRSKVGLPFRRRLPDTRRSVTHKFTVGGHEGYMSVGMFDDGAPGELFITMAKEGSTIGGLMDTIGTLTSLCLQYGVGIEVLSDKFSYQRFEPSGWTGNAEIRNATSIIDYVFRWLQFQFVAVRAVAPPETVKALVVATPKPQREMALALSAAAINEVQNDNPPCPKCGHITERAGKCHRCPNCGEQTGCS
jgi:ribonucleoside-diphosphate reductase alpha chain